MRSPAVPHVAPNGRAPTRVGLVGTVPEAFRLCLPGGGPCDRGGRSWEEASMTFHGPTAAACRGPGVVPLAGFGGTLRAR